MSFPIVLVVACAPAPETTSTTLTTHEQTQTTQPTPTTGTTTLDPDPTTTTDPDPTSTTDPTLDPTAPIPDFGEHDLGCNGKIDFLFVIDRALWMESYWERFHAAFPPFLEDLLATFANFDLHFMTVDATNGWGLYECIEQCQENNGSCLPVGPADYYCDHHIDQDTECEMMGSGVIATGGFGASNRDCGVVGDRRFIVGREQPDLLDAVQCISQVGYGTSDAGADYAMMWALTPDSPPAHCNEGFLRDDAVLVIVFFSALANQESQVGTPGEWAETIYDLKGGDKDRVAVIGIVDDASGDGPTICPGPGTGTYVHYPAAFLHYYIKHKVEGSVCADDYSPTLADGLEMIRVLCDAEIPK